MIDILLQDIRIDFGFKQILKSVSFEIKQGDKIGIVDGNGAGKTTLFNIITRTQPPDSGAVTVRKGVAIGYLEQTPEKSEVDTGKPSKRLSRIR